MLDGLGRFLGLDATPEAATPADPGTTAIPDAAAVAGDQSLRYEALNQKITTGYSQLARDFQAIVDPGFARTGTSGVDPVWFAFAPYASRQAGLGMIEAGQVATLSSGLDRALGPIGPVLHATLGDAVPLLGDGAGVLALVLERLGGGKLADGAAGEAIAAKRLTALIASAPGHDGAAKLASVMQTLRNALEDGNRRIYGDIGASGESYLHWRGALPSAPTPDQVASQFRLPGSDGATRAPEIYRWARDAASQGSSRPTDIGAQFPSPPADTHDLVVAAFALFEEAGTTRDPARKNDLVAMANVLIAYREQHDSVAPAFDPGRVLPGEVDRKRLFELVTPAVTLPVRAGGGFSFASYAQKNLPARGSDARAPRATDYNWADFSTRWGGILSAFETAYSSPRAMWPLPPADPRASDSRLTEY